MFLLNLPIKLFPSNTASAWRDAAGFATFISMVWRRCKETRKDQECANHAEWSWVYCTFGGAMMADLPFSKDGRHKSSVSKSVLVSLGV